MYQTPISQNADTILMGMNGATILTRWDKKKKNPSDADGAAGNAGDGTDRNNASSANAAAGSRNELQEVANKMKNLKVYLFLSNAKVMIFVLRWKITRSMS